VPETPDTRVLTPAESAHTHGYGGGGPTVVPIPRIEGRDVTYPTHIDHSADFFYCMPEGHRPWIAALDGEGKGLVQTSTERLKGRKLFVWGTGAGGKRWQEFLSAPGHAYIEIQAGLAPTQREYVPLPARAEWSWLESYGLMEADPAAVHGADWTQARRAAERSLERLLPRATLDRESGRASECALRPPVELLHRGSGWGALERRRREAFGEQPFCSTALVFDDESLTVEQEPWTALLANGEFPGCGAATEPRGYLVQAEWRALVEAAAEKGGGTNWLAWLHLGVMRYHAGERALARQAWERALGVIETPWAMRNLAVLAQEEARSNDAVELLVAACRMRPGLRPLATECGRTLLAADRPREWLDLLTELAPSVRTSNRVRLLQAQAALAVGDLDMVGRLFTEGLVIDDLREGERALSDLWLDFQERRVAAAERVPIDAELRARVRREFPVPREIDFRMSSDPSPS